jgi:hypothetical protein
MSPALPDDGGFESALNGVCGRLEDKQAEYSVRRLRELEARLELLEDELDAFILGKSSGNPAVDNRTDSVSEAATAPVTRNAK